MWCELKYLLQTSRYRHLKHSKLSLITKKSIKNGNYEFSIVFYWLQTNFWHILFICSKRHLETNKISHDLVNIVKKLNNVLNCNSDNTFFNCFLLRRVNLVTESKLFNYLLQTSLYRHFERENFLLLIKKAIKITISAVCYIVNRVFVCFFYSLQVNFWRTFIICCKLHFEDI